MVLLRDGRTLIGTLRSVDQFANLVLQDCIERIHVGKQFGDIPRGIFVVRGENVVRKTTFLNVGIMFFLFIKWDTLIMEVNVKDTKSNFHRILTSLQI